MNALRLRRVDLLVTICFAALPMSACGGSKSDGGSASGSSSEKSAGGTSSTNADASPSTAGASPGTGGSPGSLPCGTTNCTLPEGSKETLCCQDQFAGICGVKNRTGCVNPPKPPPKGCPKLPSVRGFMGNACCTTAGQCGIQQRGFGQACVDVATAAAQASMMGVNIGQVPPPTSCTPGDGGA